MPKINDLNLKNWKEKFIALENYIKTNSYNSNYAKTILRKTEI